LIFAGSWDAKLTLPTSVPMTFSTPEEVASWTATIHGRGLIDCERLGVCVHHGTLTPTTCSTAALLLMNISPLLMLDGRRSMPYGQIGWNAIASTRVALGDHATAALLKTSSEKRSVPACRNR
jgi:hypothetical protein